MAKKTPSKIPFIVTHKLVAHEKSGPVEGDITVDVMALVQDGVTRLFNAEEASEGTLPEYRVKTPITDAAEITSGIQRNRKDVKSATLMRLGEVVSFTIDAGELVAAKTTLAPWVAPKPVKVEPVKAAPLPANDQADVAQAALKELAAKVAAGDQTGLDELRKLISVTPAKGKKAKSTPAATGPDGKTHRAGSVQSMTIDELRAEFTAKTGQPAPSNSIHYMRKMVLQARNGKKDFKRRATKIPTLTLGHDDAVMLLKALDTGSLRAPGDGEKIAAVTKKLVDFAAESTTEVRAAA